MESVVANKVFLKKTQLTARWGLFGSTNLSPGYSARQRQAHHLEQGAHQAK
jgi:hypothetical protein